MFTQPHYPQPFPVQPPYAQPVQLSQPPYTQPPFAQPVPSHFTHLPQPPRAPAHTYPFPPYAHAAAGSSSQIPVNPPPFQATYPSRPPMSFPNNPLPNPFPRRCHMCGGTEGVDLAHPINIRLCPETLRLIRENAIMFHPKLGRLTFPDGSDFPPFSMCPNGWASLFPSTGQRDAAPHPSSAATCALLGVYYDDMPIYSKPRETRSADASSSCFPVITRSQSKAGPEAAAKHKSVRFADDDPPSAASHRQDTPISQIRPKDSTTTEHVHSTSQPAAPSAPLPINTEDGWLREQRSKRRATVEDAKDEDAPHTTHSQRQHPTRIPPRNSSVKFTSDIQESVSFDDIQSQILGARVSLTLRELMAMAPSLQKRIANLVKTRREVDFKAVAINTATSLSPSKLTATDSEPIAIASPASQGASFPSVTFATDRVLPDDTIRQLAELIADSPSDPNLEASITFVQGQEELTDLLQRYAASIALGQPRKFAMVSGFVTFVFGDQKAVFLIDTGSELNLVNHSLWKRTGPTMDPDGARWNLRGIGGEFVSLLGCITDAPVQLSGKNFDHHFFVSGGPTSPQHDGILGQPWLSHFSAQIGYTQGGSVELTVFPTGIKTGPSISLSIATATHPRNAESLVLTGCFEFNEDF